MKNKASNTFFLNLVLDSTLMCNLDIVAKVTIIYSVIASTLFLIVFFNNIDFFLADLSVVYI